MLTYHMYGGQRRTWRNWWLSPSTTGDLGIKLRSTGLAVSTIIQPCYLILYFWLETKRKWRNFFSRNHLGVHNRLVVWLLIKSCVWPGGERFLHSGNPLELLQILHVKRIWWRGFSATVIILLFTYLKPGLFIPDSFKHLITNLLLKFLENRNRWPHLQQSEFRKWSPGCLRMPRSRGMLLQILQKKITAFKILQPVNQIQHFLSLLNVSFCLGFSVAE